MDMDKLVPTMTRVFFAGAFILLALAVGENVLNEFGGSIPVLDAVPMQFLNYALILPFFVIAHLLRQIRDTLRST